MLADGGFAPDVLDELADETVASELGRGGGAQNCHSVDHGKGFPGATGAAGGGGEGSSGAPHGARALTLGSRHADGRTEIGSGSGFTLAMTARSATLSPIAAKDSLSAARRAPAATSAPRRAAASAPYAAISPPAAQPSVDKPESDAHFARTVLAAGSSSTYRVDIYGVRNDSNVFPALQHAFDILSDAWTSKVVVNTRVTFTDLGPPNALATGGGVLFVRFDASPDRELLPIAAAEAMTSVDLNARETGLDKYDVLVKINHATPWHVNFHEHTPTDKYDIVTVLLHEVYHNLIFSGAITVDTSSPKAPHAFLLDGYPARFDLFLANEHDCAVLDYLKDTQLASSTNATNGQLLAESVTNNRLFFHDPESGVRIPLYAPEKYTIKSSIYHTVSSRRYDDDIMSYSVPAGFQDRTISSHVLQIQRAMLDPNHRGAKHCKFPLSDPSARRAANKIAPPAAVGHVPKNTKNDPKQGSPSSLHVPKWAIIVACGAGALACISLILGLVAAVGKHVRMKRGLASGVMSLEKRPSIASSGEILIDDEFSTDDIEFDIRDIEIDEQDFKLVDYRLPDRDSKSSQ
ncbi:hypothetical protein FGB62_12g358 [Gracilaria domingensis]|nr:hypothetical protein FGB62_12g358 [Gracilaria domingensis]